MQGIEEVLEGIERAQARLRGLLRSVAQATHSPDRAPSHGGAGKPDYEEDGARAGTYLEDAVESQVSVTCLQWI